MLTILLIDQVIKVWVKTQMQLGEHFDFLGLSWFKIYFTENPGMAFGMQLGGSYGKVALSLFRIVAVGAIAWYLQKLIKEQAAFGLLAGIALVFSGALGNIIDSVFYGLLFSGSQHSVASFWPEEGGYAGFLHGHVVDMFFFPLFEGRFPEWFPFWGGQNFVFFEPIFNFADAAISVGVFIILVGYRSFFTEEDKAKEEGEADKAKESLNTEQSSSS